MGTSGIVLAGGQSRRMGRDKLSLTVGGSPVLRRVYDVLAEACDEVIVVAGGAGDPAGIPDDALLVRDLRSGGSSGLGPLAGLESGLVNARHPWTFVAAGDMPFLSPGLVSELLRRLRSSGASAVVPRINGRWEPLCAAYDRRMLGYVSSALEEGRRAMRALIERLPEVEEVAEEELGRFGEPGTVLMNVNSPEDLARARTFAGEERDG